MVWLLVWLVGGLGWVVVYCFDIVVVWIEYECFVVIGVVVFVDVGSVVVVFVGG